MDVLWLLLIEFGHLILILQQWLRLTDEKNRNTSIFFLCLQDFWLVRPAPEDHPTSIILVFPKCQTMVETGRIGRLEETRGLIAVQRRDPKENLVGTLGNLSAEAQGPASNLGVGMISLGVNLVRAFKKVKVKTNSVVTEMLGVAIRMDAPARRGDTRGYAVTW